jgi:hypothetical protein
VLKPFELHYISNAVKLNGVSKKPIPKAAREYLSQIGSITSEKKTASARANAAKAHAARKRNVLDLPCICGAGDDLTPGAHPTTCPRGRLLYQRARSAAARAAKQSEATT